MVPAMFKYHSLTDGARLKTIDVMCHIAYSVIIIFTKYRYSRVFFIPL